MYLGQKNPRNISHYIPPITHNFIVSERPINLHDLKKPVVLVRYFRKWPSRLWLDWNIVYQ